MIWKILIIGNLLATTAIYTLVYIAVRNIKKKKKTAVSVRQVSPKK